MSRYFDIFRLLRIVNCLLAGVGVWIGAYLTWLTPSYYGPTVAGIGAILLCGAGNALNDYLDIEIDRVNRPDRVLVRGGLTRRFALWLAIAFAAISLIMGLAVSWPVALIAILTIALLLAYNLKLKRLPLIGNLAVALLAGLTFITGGLAVEPTLTFRLPGPLIAATFAFLFHVVREIVKDVQDIDGDRQAGYDTLTIRIGEAPALAVALGFFVLLVLLTYLPIIYGWFGRTYEIITVYIVDLPLLGLLIILYGHPTRQILMIASLALKIGMVLGLAALVLA